MVRELSQSEISNFLDSQRFARLGCHVDGETYVVPITFARDGDRLVGQTKAGKKVDMMRKNPVVCLQMDAVTSFAEWTSVICWGRFEELKGQEANDAMGSLIDHMESAFDDIGPTNRSLRDITPAEPDAIPQVAIVYAIHLQKMTGRAETPDA